MVESQLESSSLCPEPAFLICEINVERLFDLPKVVISKHKEITQKCELWPFHYKGGNRKVKKAKIKPLVDGRI